MYLGAGIRKVKLDNGMEAWAASSSQYVQAAVRNVEEYIEKSHHKRWRIPNKVETPMQSTYRPELDVSEELSSSNASYYQSLIGILWWIVELGHIVCLSRGNHDVLSFSVAKEGTYGTSDADFWLSENVP